MNIPEKEVAELEEFFKKATFPKFIQLNEGSKIDDIPKFVESHISVLRNNPDKGIYEPFYDRLILLKQLLNGL